MLLSLLLAACGGGPSPALTPPPPDPDRPELVALVVLDTVRADHTGLCGDPRPITPHLDALARRPGAAAACHAITPGSWTHPSHASMFTGEPVSEHGAVWVTDSPVALNAYTRVRPLAERYETLAETYRDRGYQTVAISANVILVPQSGLLQGFDVTEVADGMQALRGPRFRATLRRVLDRLDPDRPLFLFVNLYDAHDPYPAVPPDAGWLPAQPRTHLHPEQDTPDNPYVRFVRGTATPEEADALLTTVKAGYARGVHEADANLGLLLKQLDKRGWTDGGARVVVTSDHGEMLGEHQLLRHGGFLYEEMLTVPLVVWDTTRGHLLEDRMSTQAVHRLLKDGHLPTVPLVALSEHNPDDVLGGRWSIARWEKGRKLVVDLDGATRTDLGRDPGEAAPEPAAEDDEVAALRAALRRVREMAVPEGEAGMTEALKTVGYVE